MALTEIFFAENAKKHPKSKLTTAESNGQGCDAPSALGGAGVVEQEQMTVSRLTLLYMDLQ